MKPMTRRQMRALGIVPYANWMYREPEGWLATTSLPLVLGDEVMLNEDIFLIVEVHKPIGQKNVYGVMPLDPDDYEENIDMLDYLWDMRG